MRRCLLPSAVSHQIRALDGVLDVKVFERCGIALALTLTGPGFPNCEIATMAAEQGQGGSRTYDAMVRGSLESGRLLRLFEPGYVLGVRLSESRADDPMTRVFTRWIRAEAAADVPRAQSAAAAE